MVDRICDNCMSRVPADSEKCPRCGIRFENTNPGGALPNGWVLGGRYTVGRYMEIDGEGVTYSAIDGNTLQRVIVKEYMPVTLCATRDETGSIVPKPGNEVLFKTTRMDFRELYDTLMRLGLTEGLVQVLDVLEENNTAYAVVEQVEGPTLAEYLTKTGEPLEPARALALLRPVMMGVESMHAANLVHRGISPENIILESGGTAKLGGFGTLALRQQGSELKPKLYPGYSAPEQYAANEFEGRYTDVYAFGAVLYRMLTDEAPEPADERKIQDNMSQARQLNKEVPNFVSAAISRALRIAPAERIPTLGDLRLELSGEGGRDTRRKKSGGGGGVSSQQLIIGGVAVGAIVLILIIILVINLVGGGRTSTSTTTSSETETTTTTSTASIASEASQPGEAIPNFLGQTRVWVEQNYSHFSFNWQEDYSEAYPEGQVMGQAPDAGQPYGGVVTLTVSKGPDPAAITESMPDFVGTKTTETAARTSLANLGVDEANITIVVEQNDGTYDEGQVMRTSPTPGTTFSVASDKIILYVAGEKPYEMPDLKGKSYSDALATLDAQGIGTVVEWELNDGSYVPDTVARTSPAAGEKYYSGTVTIYMASSVSLPNVVGMNVDEATRTLNAVGNVKITIDVQERESDSATGTVLSMDPTAGTEVGENVTVTLIVAAPPEEAG